MAFVTGGLWVPPSHCGVWVSLGGGCRCWLERPCLSARGRRPSPVFRTVGSRAPTALLEDAPKPEVSLAIRVADKKQEAMEGILAVYKYAKTVSLNERVDLMLTAASLSMDLNEAYDKLVRMEAAHSVAMDKELAYVSSEMTRMSTTSVYSSVQSARSSLFADAATLQVTVVEPDWASDLLRSLCPAMEETRECSFYLLSQYALPKMYGDLMLSSECNFHLINCVNTVLDMRIGDVRGDLSWRSHVQVGAVKENYNALVDAVNSSSGPFKNKLLQAAELWRNLAALRVVLDAVINDPDKYQINNLVNQETLMQEVGTCLDISQRAMSSIKGDIQFSVNYTMTADGHRELDVVSRKMKAVMSIPPLGRERNDVAHERPTEESLRHVLTTSFVPSEYTRDVVSAALQLEAARKGSGAAVTKCGEQGVRTPWQEIKRARQLAEATALPLLDLEVMRAMRHADVTKSVQRVQDRAKLPTDRSACLDKLKVARENFLAEAEAVAKGARGCVPHPVPPVK